MKRVGATGQADVPKMAIKSVQRAVRTGWHFALKTDIKNCFPSINRKMLAFVLRECFDDELADFLLIPISSSYVTEDVPHYRRIGLPQGNGLSPVLANIFLTLFDVACSELRLWRYADDVLVLARTEGELLQAREIVQSAAEMLRLSLNVEKTIEVGSL